MSATYLLDPLIIHHVNPATAMALGAGLASAASVVAAGVMGRWFTRAEREARAEDAPARLLGAGVQASAAETLAAPTALGNLTFGPTAPMLPLTPIVHLPLGTPTKKPIAASGSGL